MNKFRSTAVAGALMLFGASGCADLVVPNLNDPDAERALQTATDVQSLITPAFNTWWYSGTDYSGPTLFLSVQSFQHAATPANAGMYFYSKYPREAIVNSTSDPEYGNVVYNWYESYEALAGIADGLTAIQTGDGIAEELGEDQVLMITAYAKLMQGLLHGNIALLYDQGYIVDENTERFEPSGATIPLETVPYPQMQAAAIGYLDEAIALAEGEDFLIPSDWMAQEWTAEEFVEFAYSWKARILANVARTPEERAAVDWAGVLTAVDNGIEETLELDVVDRIFWDAIRYQTFRGWQQLNYQILGMADQSGQYQIWINTPPEARNPQDTGGSNFAIVTDDTRFAQGATIEEQEENPGTQFEVPPFSPSSMWNRPDRGSYRWSWYWNIKGYDYYYNYGEDQTMPIIEKAEMDLLAAEAHYNMGNRDEAADLINISRTANGLSATDGIGTNTSCVPKLPDGTCGGLFEMLKWEKRLETQFNGPLSMGWYFDGRGWGELYAGTQLQLPMPAGELLVMEMPVYTFGGIGGASASPGSIYDWPYENP